MPKFKDIEEEEQQLQKDQEEQVEDMLKDFQPEVDEEEEDDSKKKKSEAVDEELELEEEDKEDFEEDLELEEGADEEDEIEEDEIEDEPAEDKIIDSDLLADLKQQIADLQDQVKQGKAQEEPTEEQEQPKVEMPELNLGDIVNQNEVAEAMTDPEKLTALLQKVLSTANQHASQQILKQIPSVVKAETERTVTTQSKIKSFYEENEDLLPHRKYVGYVANQIEAQNPNISLDELLERTNETVREDLRLQAVAEETETKRKKKRKKSTFAQKPKGGRPTPKSDQRSEQEKEIDSMLDTLDL